MDNTSKAVGEIKERAQSFFGYAPHRKGASGSARSKNQSKKKEFTNGKDNCDKNCDEHESETNSNRIPYQ